MPRRPPQSWTDRGLVLISNARNDFNAIDPFRIDLSDGRAFLAFGSFWSGSAQRARSGDRQADQGGYAGRLRWRAATAGAIEALLDPRARREILPLRQLRPVLQRRRLDLQHSRRPRRQDRGSVPGQRRQGDARRRRLAHARHDRPNDWPRRARAGENHQRATCSPTTITTATRRRRQTPVLPSPLDLGRLAGTRPAAAIGPEPTADRAGVSGAGRPPIAISG